MNHTIAIAEDALAIRRCFAAMSELRPHLNLEQFVAQVLRQQEAGYRLAFVESAGEVRAVAGFRITEILAWGRFLYVDDLVTRAADQGSGFGSVLFDWLIAQAQSAGCQQLHLDSGVHRFGAHRFYLHKGMDITSHHFAMKL